MSKEKKPKKKKERESEWLENGGPQKLLPEESLGYDLWFAAMHWQRAVKHALDPLEITHTQLLIMSALRNLELEGAVTQQAICRLTGLDKMMTSKILKNLQMRALLERQRHAEDVRANDVRLSAKGLEILEKAQYSLAQVELSFFSKGEKFKKSISGFTRSLK